MIAQTHNNVTVGGVTPTSFWGDMEKVSFCVNKGFGFALQAHAEETLSALLPRVSIALCEGNPPVTEGCEPLMISLLLAGTSRRIP